MRQVIARWLNAILAALIVSALPLPAVARETITIALDGIARQALIDPGKDAATTPSPLVLAFHGATQSATDMTTLGLARA
jgi:poly(3-hydroxybutyrate) depolymerase